MEQPTSSHEKTVENFSNIVQTNLKEEQRALFIGEKYKEYYQSRFEKITPKKQMVGFHWAAFFLTFAWMFYRKMYVLGFGFLVLMISISLILENLGMSNSSTGIGISVVCGLMGNAIYMQFVDKKIEKINAGFNTEDEINREIQKQGGTNPIALGISIAIIIILVMFSIQ